MPQREVTPVWGEQVPPFLLRDFKEISVTDQRDVWWRRFPWLALMLLLGLGAVLIAVPAFANWSGSGIGSQIIQGLGMAFVGAAALGITADFWLKQQLVRDAFEATFGYLLPDELRGELEWIYKQDLICTGHDQTVTIAETDDPLLVRVTVEARRTIKNAARKTVPYRPTFALDEWGHEGRPTVIEQLGCEKAGQRVDAFEPESPGPTHVAVRLSEEFKLAPGDVCTVWFRGTETHPRNGEIRLALLAATVDPIITIVAPKDLRAVAEFGGRENHPRELEPGTVQFGGTLLPLQALRVRWSPTSLWGTD
jgi:hypothetical protein